VRHPLLHHLAHMWVHAHTRTPNTRARIYRSINASTRTHLTRARTHRYEAHGSKPECGQS
jgi:hypothetical protein